MERIKIGALLAKAETTYDTDPTPTAAVNAIAVLNNTLTYKLLSTRTRRNLLDGGYRSVPGFITQKTAEITFQTELRGNKTALTEYAAQAVVATNATDLFTLTAHTLRNGDLVKFAGTAVPSGLVADTWYYVVGITATTFQVSASFGGAAINFTTDGTDVTMTSFRPDVRAGSANWPHECDPLYQASDFAPTYTAEASLGAADGNVTYKPTIGTDQGASATFYWYSALKLHKLTGAKGTFRLVYEAGKPAMIEWNFKGRYIAITDATFSTVQSALVFSGTKPPLFIASTTTYDSYAAVFSKLDLTLGNNVQRRDDATGTDGLRGFIITDRNSVGSFNPESVAEATHPFWADMNSDEVDTLSVLLGSVAGNKVLLTASTQLTGLDYADQNETRVHQAQFEVVAASVGATLGNELTLKFF